MVFDQWSILLYIDFRHWKRDKFRLLGDRIEEFRITHKGPRRLEKISNWCLDLNFVRKSAIKNYLFNIDLNPALDRFRIHLLMGRQEWISHFHQKFRLHWNRTKISKYLCCHFEPWNIWVFVSSFFNPLRIKNNFTSMHSPLISLPSNEIKLLSVSIWLRSHFLAGQIALPQSMLFHAPGVTSSHWPLLLFFFGVIFIRSS